MNKERKQQLRREMRDQKKAISLETLKTMSAPLCHMLMHNEHYKNANIVMLYAALWDEVDLSIVLSEALKTGKHVIYPSVIGDDIIPKEITKETIWTKGEFGILEPQALAYEGKINTIVVPGVAFDTKGNRLGRGKGYYDRFLAQHPESYRLGICYPFQLVAEVPSESFDLSMDEVIGKY